MQCAHQGDSPTHRLAHNEHRDAGVLGGHVLDIRREVGYQTVEVGDEAARALRTCQG
jgi:hypothetical protein